MIVRLVAISVVLLALPAIAQVVPERELEITKSLFDAGNYREAIKRAADAMTATTFTDVQRIELHRLVGLSAFNLADTAAAQAAFLQLLQLNPDFVLDPFSAPPPAIRLFEQVRTDHQAELALLRQQIALRVEQEKKAIAQKERERLEEEERRRRLAELSQTVLVRTVERHSWWTNFVPFGVGQFQQGRVMPGVAFAVTEGVLAITSIVAFFAIEGLFVKQTYTWTDRLTADKTGVFKIEVRAIPAALRTQADVWRAVKLASGIAFYAVVALGIAEALWHHEPEVVTEKRVPLVVPPRVSFFVAPGGAGAGLSWKF